MQRINIHDVGHLQRVLGEACVPIARFGTGGAKTIEQLYEEIAEGECVLGYENGRVWRQVEVVCLNVHTEGHKLTAVKQVLPDGRERPRNQVASLSEKRRPGEDPERGVYRLLREEQPVLLTLKLLIDRRPPSAEDKDSPSYPGLRSRYSYEWFETWLTRSVAAAVPLEVQEPAGITAYYEWRAV